MTAAERPARPGPAEPRSRTLEDQLRDLGEAHGLAAVGFCDAEPLSDAHRVLVERRDRGLNAEMNFTYRNPARSTDPRATLPSARSIVVGALRYDTTLPARPDGDRPVARVARYATADHYRELREALTVIRDHLKELGHKAVVVADENALVDRAVAVKAGIGWYGKSANVLLPGKGSWFVLGSVITNAELTPATEPVADGCGSCTSCMDHCPTGAIIAPGVVDANLCLSWRLQAPGDFPVELRGALADRIYGCDDCQEYCPPSRRADRRGIAAPGHPPEYPLEAGAGSGGSWVDVEWMLSASDDELLDRLGRWYVPRRDPRYLRRNALVVYGNTAGGRDDATVEAVLAPYLDGDDDMLKRHAAWAAITLGRREILDEPSRRADRVISDEIVALDRDAVHGDRRGDVVATTSVVPGGVVDDA